MAKDLFATLDLNLLKVFQIIYQERNLSKAAERLFVTQPAVSKSLAKLRHHFNNELFVRSYQGLLPTDFSEQLYRNLGPAITSVSRAVNASISFQPATLTDQIKISVSPLLMHDIGEALYQSIHSEAPQVKLILLNWSAKTLSHIHNQEIDLGINYILNNNFKDVTTQLINKDKYSIYARKDHPFPKDVITPEELSQQELMTLIDADWNFHKTVVEAELNKHGYSANIVFRCESPSVLVNALQHSDAMFPSSCTLSEKQSSQLRKIDVSVDNSLEALSRMVYCHKQQLETQKLAWLIKHIKQAIK